MLDGEIQYYLGVWVYNQTRLDWPKNALGIDHIAYKEPPGKRVFDVMGFNSAQISAAHSQIGAAVHGLPLLRRRPGHPMNQCLEAWHEFIPFCPECPEGDRYYRDYFKGGVCAAMRRSPSA